MEIYALILYIKLLTVRNRKESLKGENIYVIVMHIR